MLLDNAFNRTPDQILQLETLASFEALRLLVTGEDGGGRSARMLINKETLLTYITEREARFKKNFVQQPVIGVDLSAPPQPAQRTVRVDGSTFISYSSSVPNIRELTDEEIAEFPSRIALQEPNQPNMQWTYRISNNTTPPDEEF